MRQVQITIRDHEEELLRQAREKIGGRCPATEAEFIETAVRQRIGVNSRPKVRQSGQVVDHKM